MGLNHLASEERHSQLNVLVLFSLCCYTCINIHKVIFKIAFLVKKQSIKGSQRLMLVIDEIDEEREVLASSTCIK